MDGLFYCSDSTEGWWRSPTLPLVTPVNLRVAICRGLGTVEVNLSR